MVPEQFRRAMEKASKLTLDPGNEVKLKMYALFKQVMLGGSGCDGVG